MTRIRSRKLRAANPAFSLTELVIVVVIIGIIAAIAVTRLASGATNAGEAALKRDLGVLRGAIDQYAGEHGGAWPGSHDDGVGNAALSPGAFINQLSKYTSESGGVADAWDASHPFGPYLWRIPPLPVGQNKGNNTVAIDSANSPPLVTAGSEGWVYNPTTGQILANSDDPNAAGTRTFDEY